MPRTVLLGRPLPKPGEPLFLDEDTDGALALAEEERAHCQSCGLLKIWCRDPEHQFAFDVDEEVCWATYRLELRRDHPDYQGRDSATKTATHLAPRFRKGKQPDNFQGLDLER